MIVRLATALDGPRLGRVGWIWFLLALLPGGCQSGTFPEAFDVSVNPPSDWSVRPLTDYTVPGEPLAAWSGPDHSSLVVFQTLPAPGATATSLAVGEARRFDAYPGATHVDFRVMKLPAGMEAGRVEAVAPGTGDALVPPVTGVARSVQDPKSADADRSLVPTRRISLVIPHPSGPIWIQWHLPESAYESLAPQVDAMIGTLSLGNR